MMSTTYNKFWKTMGSKKKKINKWGKKKLTLNVQFSHRTNQLNSMKIKRRK